MYDETKALVVNNDNTNDYLRIQNIIIINCHPTGNPINQVNNNGGAARISNNDKRKRQNGE